MMYNAKNLTICLHDDSMECVSFGTGEKPLVLIPGLSDGMSTVKGMAKPFALLYRYLAKRYKVYMFSRRNHLSSMNPENVTTRNMASDLAEALDKLMVEHAYVVGISMGGMIAQWLAIDHPEKVERLAIVVSAAKSNISIQEVVSNWIDLAERDKIKELMIDTAERTYTGINRVLPNMYAGYMKLSDKKRFILQAKACLMHDAWDDLERIQKPVLVIGGRKDMIIGAEASEALHQKIKDSELYIYDQYGHGLYEEANDFWQRIAAFSGGDMGLIRIDQKAWILETDLGIQKQFDDRDVRNILEAVLNGTRDFLIAGRRESIDTEFIQVSMEQDCLSMIMGSAMEIYTHSCADVEEAHEIMKDYLNGIQPDLTQWNMEKDEEDEDENV